MASDTPLRFPTRPAASAEASGLAAELRSELLLAGLDDEPSYELLERATNGELSEEESEALALRAEWDEELALELAELAALRDRLAARGKVAPRRVSRVWRTAGLAAALLVAAIGVDRALEQKAADASYAGVSAAPAAPQALFQDGFENGTSSTWTN